MPLIKQKPLQTPSLTLPDNVYNTRQIRYTTLRIAYTAINTMPPRKKAVTDTERIKEVLKLQNTRIKTLMAEHIRAMIRAYGIGGIKDSAVEAMMYEILFLDPLTVRHFGQFQAMWPHRASKRAQHTEFWDQFRAFLRDCIDKTRAANNFFANVKYLAYQDNAEDFYDSPAIDWPTLQADRIARVQWFPQPRYRTPPPIPVGPAPLLPLRIFVVDPAATRYRPPIADEYPLWDRSVVETTVNVASYTMAAVFAAAAVLCQHDRHPRALYGCRLNPRNPADAGYPDGNVPPRMEANARLQGATYNLLARDTTQLTSDATVSAWSAAAVGAAHHTPTIIAVLARWLGTDTPPRDVECHFNTLGIPMPVREASEYEGSDDGSDNGSDDGEQGNGEGGRNGARDGAGVGDGTGASATDEEHGDEEDDEDDDAEAI
jgi:hypothetical protein